jgi:predicted ATPase
MLASERSPLRVDSLDLHNFRGIRQLTLRFDDTDAARPEVVLFVGANASGKNSVLEAIALLFGAAKAEYATPHAQEGVVRFGAPDFLIRAWCSYGPQHQPDQAAIRVPSQPRHEMSFTRCLGAALASQTYFSVGISRSPFRKNIGCHSKRTGLPITASYLVEQVIASIIILSIWRGGPLSDVSSHV